MSNNQIDIPVKIEVDTEEVKDQLKGIGSVLLGNVLEMLIGKRGLIHPEFETRFWIGQYYVDIKMR